MDGFITLVEDGIADDVARPFAGGDTYFGGVYAGFGPLISERFDIDGYLLALVSPRASRPMMADREWGARFTAGSRVKHRAGMIDTRLEAGVQAGRDDADRRILAYHGNLEVGAIFLDDRLRFAVEGLIASGDDPDTTGANEGFHHLFPTAHKWLGLADVIGFGGGRNGSGRSNLLGGVLHVEIRPAPAWTARIDAHYFARPEDFVLVDPLDPMLTTRLSSGPAAFELDVGGGYDIGPGLKVRTGYSLFLPDRAWYGIGDPAHFWELELRYDR